MSKTLLISGISISIRFCVKKSLNFYSHYISAAMTVENGGVDSHTLHVGMLGVAGVMTLLFPFYSGPVS